VGPRAGLDRCGETYPRTLRFFIMIMVGEIYISLPVTVQGDSCSFDIAESKGGNQIVLSHSPMSRERGIN
jgi:hypothetical protein